MTTKTKNKLPTIRNFVAKHCREFNRSTVMVDKKKQYSRTVKHRNSGRDYVNIPLFV